MGQPPVSETHPLGRHRWDFLFPIALAVLHAVLWHTANRLEGVWFQAPATDQSHDLRTAWLFYHAFADANVTGVVDAWINGSPVHTPFVPLTSALLMLAFGESRLSAEFILPVYTAIWLLATYVIFRRLYDVETARWTTALVSTFPVFLIYSRTYLFDHPLAAMFACACWALIRSEGFDRLGASIVFGILAGLAALTRGAGAVFLVGPVFVVCAVFLQQPDRARRIRNASVAALIALTIAATWYLPNLPTLAAYVFRATCGEDAVTRTGGTSALSLANVGYYVVWIIAQGPGVPIAGLAVLSWILGRFLKRNSATATLAVPLALVFAIDFVLLTIAAQREAARYFQPLMPLVALATYKAVAGIGHTAVRRAIAALVIALSAHHVTSLSLVLDGSASPSFAAAPYFRSLPLWDHRTYFSQLVEYYRLGTPQDDFCISETVDLLATLNLPPHAVIGTISTPHAFFQPNGLQLEAVRRRLGWSFVWSRALDPSHPDRLSESLPRLPVDAILSRSGGPTGVTARELQRFQPVRSITLGDGSVVAVLVRGLRRDE